MEGIHDTNQACLDSWRHLDHCGSSLAVGSATRVSSGTDP
ncbi:hypothetical protein ATKI12_4403 [Kitasatospora sp. Ki12]